MCALSYLSNETFYLKEFLNDPTAIQTGPGGKQAALLYPQQHTQKKPRLTHSLTRGRGTETEQSRAA